MVWKRSSYMNFLQRGCKDEPILQYVITTGMISISVYFYSPRADHKVEWEECVLYIGLSPWCWREEVLEWGPAPRQPTSEAGRKIKYLRGRSKCIEHSFTLVMDRIMQRMACKRVQHQRNERGYVDSDVYSVRAMQLQSLFELMLTKTGQDTCIKH